MVSKGEWAKRREKHAKDGTMRKATFRALAFNPVFICGSSCAKNCIRKINL